MEINLYEEISFALRMLPVTVAIGIPRHYKIDQWHKDLQQVADDINFHEYIYCYAPDHVPGDQVDKMYMSFKPINKQNYLEAIA
jgi:hypothetical protein